MAFKRLNGLREHVHSLDRIESRAFEMVHPCDFGRPAQGQHQLELAIIGAGYGRGLSDFRHLESFNVS